MRGPGRHGIRPAVRDLGAIFGIAGPFGGSFRKPPLMIILAGTPKASGRVGGDRVKGRRPAWAQCHRSPNLNCGDSSTITRGTNFAIILAKIGQIAGT